MQEEFYAILKLTSGEEVLALVSIDENDGDPLVVMQNPITMKVLHSPHGMHVKVKSWIEMSSDSIFIIRPDKIITMTETQDEKIIDIYNNYISDDDDDNIDVYNSERKSTDEPTGKIKPSRKMGYLSTVEEARVALEELYNLKDTKES